MSDKGLMDLYGLRSRLRFNPENAGIWLDEHRMLLLHARAFGALRKELFDTLGVERARGALVRMGFVSGRQDAELARRLVGDGSLHDVFLIGPELHTLEGVTHSTVVRSNIDFERGTFDGEFIWDNAWEAESHIQHFGVGEAPACWSQVGYASGYVSGFLNRFVAFREVECVARGDPHCRILGKPADEWQGPDAESYLRYFRPESIVGELLELQEEVAQLRASLGKDGPAGSLIGVSAGFRAAFDLLSRAAASTITVLLLGETGVGKERFARWLHENGPRAAQPFVAVNCAAMPHELIESELFGVQKGAYTGAQASRPGRFERAHGGTLFLDEVGDLSPAAQVKLLRVLQTGEIERLGDSQMRKVDVRLVAATNVDLQRAIADGRFRTDLYYRLAAYPVTIPPLRERRADIPLLVEAAVARYAALYGKQVPGVTDRAMHLLTRHDWPGNIRELENVLERGVLLAAPGGCLEATNLFPGAGPQATEGVAVERSGRLTDEREQAAGRLCEQLLADAFDLEAHEARLLDLAVRRAGGNLARAARMLGITRRQLAYRLQQRGKAG